MPQIAPQEFLARPLRVHTFLSDIPMHDVWAVDLSAVRGHVSLQEFHRRVGSRNLEESLTRPARALFGLRFLLGRIFGWDQEPGGRKPEYFAERLTAEDRRRSTRAAGTPVRFFRVVYSFENEMLLEVMNRTVHAALLSALAETTDGYRLYFAVYIRQLGWVTRMYMALIDPFRRRLVYPAILKQVQRNWEEVFHRDAEAEPGITE